MAQFLLCRSRWLLEHTKQNSYDKVNISSITYSAIPTRYHFLDCDAITFLILYFFFLMIIVFFGRLSLAYNHLLSIFFLVVACYGRFEKGFICFKNPSLSLMYTRIETFYQYYIYIYI